MNYTIKYSLYSFVWFLMFPVSMILISGNIANQNTAVNSFFWVGGLCFIFYLWAVNDAKIHNISKNTVYWFTAGWLLLPIIIVAPYLYVSRGKAKGTIATVKYLLLCVTFFIGTGLVFKVLNYVN